MSITEISPAESLAGTAVRRHHAAPVIPTLPVVAPGQLWLVELPADGALRTPARHAIGEVNVVIYDRTLVDAVAHSLPLGGYAEPAAVASGAAVAVRCVQFGARRMECRPIVAGPPTAA